ncbi:MAG: aromatic amino acid ammonia-lyase [Thermoprotei archaeon]
MWFTIFDVKKVACDREEAKFDERIVKNLEIGRKIVEYFVQNRIPIYGVNTGLGTLVNVLIPEKEAIELQYNLIRTHAAGVGKYFSEEEARSIMFARLVSLAKGYSGISPEVFHTLKDMLNKGIIPLIPEKGSLGASGDLAPLAHMALGVIGEGKCYYGNTICDVKNAMEKKGLKPAKLSYKDGLALINGTSAMTGISCLVLYNAYNIFAHSLVSVSMALLALHASKAPFDIEGNAKKEHPAQRLVAGIIMSLIEESNMIRDEREIIKKIKEEYEENKIKIVPESLQDAYTLRAIPQVLGAILTTLWHVNDVIENELNSSSDNPLVYVNKHGNYDAFHGANFHGQHAALYMDYLAIAMTQLSNFLERQINRLLNHHLNKGLPQFLIKGIPGLNCGFEGAQYIATSLAAENRVLSTPASINNIPSNEDNQDIISMGLHAAVKAREIVKNTLTILAIHMAASYQALHLKEKPEYILGHPISYAYHIISERIKPYTDNIIFSEYIKKFENLIISEKILRSIENYFKTNQKSEHAKIFNKFFKQYIRGHTTTYIKRPPNLKEE